MTAFLLAAALTTNVLELAGQYCSYTNAPCEACIARAERTLNRRRYQDLPDGMKPAKPPKRKEPAIHILGRKYPVKGKRR